MKTHNLAFAALLFAGCAPKTQIQAQAQQPIPPRQMETLGRGVVATKTEDGTFVSWRLLGTEAQNLGFNLYRASGAQTPVRLNAQPLTGATEFLDKTADATQQNAYFVRTVENGVESADSRRFVLPANAPAKPYFSVPLQPPAPVKIGDETISYAANDGSVGDLNGDGELDFVVHMAARGKDNSQAGETSPPVLQGYKLDGTLLWTINLGRNIREGAHYTQFMVYDLDGDGRAEIVCKTADGTTDGQGKIIGDANANYVSPNGYILSGPEYMTVFDGTTGAALATTNYIPSRVPDDAKNLTPTGDQLKAIWGDGYGNRFDRFNACIAYLDGVHPSLVMARGYYTRTILVAWDWRGGQLTQRWKFDSNVAGNEKYAGQGNHNVSVADVDGDGRDEIIYGHMVVDDDGKGVFSTGIGHGDAIHVSDLDPSRPGLEVFSIQERYGDAGLHMFDAKSGEILWKIPPGKAGGDGEGPARGVSADVDPRTPGAESWGAGAGMWGKIFDAKGHLINDGTTSPPVNFTIFWDGDTLSEMLDGTQISKWDWQNNVNNVIFDAKPFDVVSNNGSKSTPVLSADILGDWREEVVWRTADSKELRIFSTTIPTEIRMRTLMSDPQYRLSVAWQNVGYNQPPHTSFFIGNDMKTPPAPNITLVKVAGVAAQPVAQTGARDAAQQTALAPLQISDIARATQAGTGPERYSPPFPPKNNLPTLWLIGDSTVRNGSKGDNGPEGQWGWGAPLVAYFDASKINVVNRALGGTSSRSFYSSNLWSDIKPLIKKGDFVMMQFGANDNGSKGALKGTDETTEIRGEETVHSFGWYLRQYVAQTRAQGATPIVLSLTPRKRWSDAGQFAGGGSHADWAAQIARETGAAFVPLNDLIAREYERLGAPKVDALFVPSPKENLHTGWDGAVVNAGRVVVGLKALPADPLAPYFSARAGEIAAGKP